MRAWVAHVFDHEVTDPSWWWQLPDDHEESPPAVAIAHLTRLFSAPSPALDRFTDEQVGQGLWFLFMGGCSDGAYVDRLGDWTLPLRERLACLEAIPGSYRHFLAARCPDERGSIAHRDSLGVTMYFLLSGKAPFEDLSLAQRDSLVSDAGFRTYRYSE